MFPEHLEQPILKAIQQHQLSDRFYPLIKTWFWPLAERLIQERISLNRSVVVGINGSQGSGKSTLADFLAVMFEHSGLKCAVLSIDDVYLTKAQRQQLAQTIHPLLATRGVPGTHDIDLGVKTISQLLQADEDSSIPLPRFNKAIDDRYPEKDWPIFSGRADIIILEGWCVGAHPQNSMELSQPINTLEANEDAQGLWRKYANDSLSKHYPALFNLLDWQIMLAAPSFDCVYAWRKEQEEKLRERVKSKGGNISGIMNDDELYRFIQHYERITRQLLREMPQRADWIFHLSEDHRILSSHNQRDGITTT